MKCPQPGDSVRITRPDRAPHATGVVVASDSPSWPVWVEHQCDCWQTGVTEGHVRGYDIDEIEAMP